MTANGDQTDSRQAQPWVSATSEVFKCKQLLNESVHPLDSSFHTEAAAVSKRLYAPKLGLGLRALRCAVGMLSYHLLPGCPRPAHCRCTLEPSLKYLNDGEMDREHLVFSCGGHRAGSGVGPHFHTSAPN